MMTLFQEIWTAFKRFTGDGWGIWAIVLVFILVLSFRDKDKRSKILWPTMLSLAVFVNPFFYKYIGIRFMSGVYWRMLWLVPIPLIIACGGVLFYSKFNKKWVRLCALAGMCIVVLFFGENVLTKNNFTVPSNIYQLPQSAVNVADAILQDEEYKEKKAIVPNELLCYVRQYTSNINLLYGRNAYGYISPIGGEEAYVHKVMSEGVVMDRAMISIISNNKKCNYVVFNSAFHSGYKDIGSLGYYDFYKSVDGYDIYKKKTVLEGY